MFKSSREVVIQLSASLLMQEKLIRQAQQKELSLLVTLQKAKLLYDKVLLINGFPKKLMQDMHTAIQAKDVGKIYYLSTEISLLVQALKDRNK